MSIEAVKDSGPSSLSTARVYKSLDGIAERLSGIESQLALIGRLEERVNNHDQQISRIENQHSSADSRLRHVEVTSAGMGGVPNEVMSIKDTQRRIMDTQRELSSLPGQLADLKRDLAEVTAKTETLERGHSVLHGQRIILGRLAMIVGTIVSSLIVYALTAGGSNGN